MTVSCRLCHDIVKNTTPAEHIKQFHPHLWNEYKQYMDHETRWTYQKPVQYFEESSLT